MSVWHATEAERGMVEAVVSAPSPTQRYVQEYHYRAVGLCFQHGWFRHQRGFSGCDKCEDARWAPGGGR